MVYDYFYEKKKKDFKVKFIAGIVFLILIVAVIVAVNIYLEIIQLDEIGDLSSIYLTNLKYKALFSGLSFVAIFVILSATNIFINRNIKKHMTNSKIDREVKSPNCIVSLVLAAIGGLLVKDFFYQKALNFLNSTSFGKSDPIFGYDIGYYTFERPFLMSIYQFFSVVWLFVIVYTLIYYALSFISVNGSFVIQDFKVKHVLRHNLINIGIYFLIMSFSYKFQREDVLYSNFIDINGAGFTDANIWLNYYKIAPFLVILIVITSFIFIIKGKLRNAAYAIGVYPVVWILVTISAVIIQGLYVKPNEASFESTYMKYNIKNTREAYNIDKVKNQSFSNMVELTPEIMARNNDTVSNMRVVDYNATLDSDTQLQSIKNYYSFVDGDIINYSINDKEIPVFITAREIDRQKLPDKTYINNTFRYTHGYGIVMNPINKLSKDGQVEFILSGLKMNSADPNIKCSENRIYYGELTKELSIVNANGLDEIDYDGDSETRYDGKGGIKLGFLNKLLFSLRYGDLNMFISNYVSSDSKLLINREIISRAQRAVPFLTVDKDPYIILSDDGKLKWVLDAYTTSSYYPYSQNAGSDMPFNYIRNSVKIVIDAYDGDAKYYIVDHSDPIINTYRKSYKNLFTDEALPEYLVEHSRYPEYLFKIQTDMFKRYYLDPDVPQNIANFYDKKVWDIAKYPEQNDKGALRTDANALKDIDPYYNMIKLPGGIGSKEELILMRPFTPYKRHNMVSWLAVRNSYENSGEKYGELILYNFPKDKNILGPYQFEVKINQNSEISQDMTLWGQGGSKVFKGNLLVIPIEESVLYVEPIYIQAAGTSSIPEVKEIVVGYQKGEEFVFGIGKNLQDALNKLFEGVIKVPEVPVLPKDEIKNTDTIKGIEITPKPDEKVNEVTPGAKVEITPSISPSKEELIEDMILKYDEIKKQLDDLGKIIDKLKAE